MGIMSFKIGEKMPIIYPRKNQNDVEFDFSTGHALGIFQFLSIINREMYGEPPNNPCSCNFSVFINNKQRNVR